MENKRTKAKNYYQANIKNCKKDDQSIIEIFLKMKELGKKLC